MNGLEGWSFDGCRMNGLEGWSFDGLRTNGLGRGGSFDGPGMVVRQGCRGPIDDG